MRLTQKGEGFFKIWEENTHTFRSKYNKKNQGNTKKITSCGMSKIPGLRRTNIPSLSEIQASGIERNHHVLNPLFLALMGHKNNEGESNKKHDDEANKPSEGDKNTE